MCCEAVFNLEGTSLKVELIDSMGSDLTVVNAARVSFDKESEWELVQSCCGNGSINGCCGDAIPAEQLSEKDQKLISYLAKHNHWTPFSHVQITMRETVPIFVARQRFKHVVGFTYNETSRRYVDEAPEFFVPDYWRKSAENKKQGSSEEEITWISNEEWEGDIKEDYARVIDDITCLYQCMINSGVAPEQARMVLPQSMYTSYYTTGSLSAWARAYNLRSEEHAQKEIQDLATQWDNIIGGIPELKYSWTALTK